MTRTLFLLLFAFTATTSAFAADDDIDCEDQQILAAIKDGDKTVLTLNLRDYIWRTREPSKEAEVCIRLLLEAGADVKSSQGTYGRESTALLDTLSHNKIDSQVLRLLLKHGANPNEPDQISKQTPVALAVSRGDHLGALKILLENGGDLSKATPYSDLLHLAVSANSTRSIDYLLEKGLDVNQKEANWGDTPIFRAVATGNMELMKKLQSKGATLNITNNSGETPLHRAMSLPEDKIEIVKFLLDAGLDPKGANQKASAPILVAAQAGNLEAIKLLETKGADLKVKTSDNANAAYMAAQSGNLKTFEYVVSKGIDVKALPSSGTSALHAAVLTSSSQGSGEIIKKLIAAGLPIEAKDPSGMTPFGRAMHFHRFDNARVLAEMGSDINGVIDQFNGYTALHAAVNYNELEMVKFLLSKGADEDAVDKSGRTPYEFAAQNRYNQEIIDLLRPNAEKRKIGRLIAWWNGWASLESEYAPNEKQKEELLQGLFYSLAQKGGVTKPAPSWAPKQIQMLYKSVMSAKNSPWELTAAALDVGVSSPEYYSLILKGARTREAAAAGKFKPTPEQAKKVIKLVLEDKSSPSRDFESLAWLISKSGLELKPEILDVFNFKKTDLKKDVADMLRSDAMKYKGFPSLAAIKLTKAFLDYPDSDFTCRKDEAGAGGFQKTELADILIWFATYADNPDCDREFFSKLARLMLEKKKVCPADRNILLRAMNMWKNANPAVQHEVVCAVTRSLGDSQPFEEQNFSDIMTLAQSVGLRSNLSQSAWFEQIKAFAKIRDNRKDSPLNENEEEVFRGILKHILGNPEGKIETKPNAIPIASSEPARGAISQLCRVSATMPEAKSFVEYLSARMDNPRSWPKGFKQTSTTPAPATLQEEFASSGLEKEASLIKNGCKGAMPAEPPKPAPTAAPQKASPIAPKKPSSTPDFDPRKRVLK